MVLGSGWGGITVCIAVCVLDFIGGLLLRSAGMNKKKLLELTELIVDLNHPIDFRIQLYLSGFPARYTNGLLGFDLSVVSNDDHENTRRFGNFDSTTSSEDLSAAIEWLKDLHEEMMIQESRK